MRAQTTCILGSITQRIFIYGNGGRRLLETPALVLAYVEKAAAFAMQDYQRDFEGDSSSLAL